MSTCRYTTRGFSLVEMLVYIGLFIVVTTAAVTTLLSFSEQARSYAVERLIFREVTPLMMRLHTELRQGTAVNTASSVLETSPGSLTFSQGATTTDIFVSGNLLTIETNGDSVTLHSDRLSTDAFWVYHYDNGNTELVRVRVRFVGSLFGMTATRTYETASVVRGSYE